MLTEKEERELEIYGRILTGTETDLDIAKWARIHYLKQKMRPRLAAIIGDTLDVVTDVLRAHVLGEAIALGIETDEARITRYRTYVQTLLAGYGGTDAILGVLEGNMSALKQELVDGYYSARQDIWTLWSTDEINRIDLPGEPQNQGAVLGSP